MERNLKKQLLLDITTLHKQAFKEGYLLQPSDIFALGYMAGKYGLEKLKDNQEKVIEACAEYDKTDDLMLLDTIGETLIDLKVITNEENKL